MMAYSFLRLPVCKEYRKGDLAKMLELDINLYRDAMTAEQAAESLNG